MLSFQAGIINVGGFLSGHRFVSHVTGFATHFGIDSISGDWTEALGMLSLPLFFLLGTVISALLVDKKRLEGKAPRYELVMGLICVLLASAALGGQAEFFGIFGDPHDLHDQYLVLLLLTLGCGLQNALFTTAAGTIVRTTHLTGTATDLGIGLVHYLSWPTLSHEQRSARAKVRRVNRLRLLSILAFIVGSAFGTWIFGLLGFSGFWIPCALAAHFIVLGHFWRA